MYHHKKTVASTSHCFFCGTLPHLHTLPTLRSSGLPHPPYRFIQLQSASYLSPHLSRRLFAAPYCLGGCSFAQPSGSAPLALRPKSRYAKAILYCFPAVLRSHHYAPLRKLRSALILRWLFDCRNPATALLEKATSAYATVPFLRCLGVFIAPLV